MRNNSTLIYFVNISEIVSGQFNLADADINKFLETMPQVEKGPSDRVIENILNFARSYEVYETENAGYVEMNLN